MPSTHLPRINESAAQSLLLSDAFDKYAFKQAVEEGELYMGRSTTVFLIDSSFTHCIHNLFIHIKRFVIGRILF
jgi:hypothetical protein